MRKERGEKKDECEKESTWVYFITDARVLQQDKYNMHPLVDDTSPTPRFDARLEVVDENIHRG